jgi:diguanylate cyclase (GGDEF)-like protein/PAS domain S-box-containing protein
MYAHFGHLWGEILMADQESSKPFEPGSAAEIAAVVDSSEFNPFPVQVDSSFHQKLLDSLHDGVYFVDRQRTILYWNRGAEALTGYSAQEVLGRFCHDNLLMHVNEAGCALCLQGCPLADTIGDGKYREVEVYLRHKFGHRVAVSCRTAPITDNHGKIIGAVEVFSDATAKKRIERRVGELESLVYLDSLTGVPNRRYIELRVGQAIQEVEQFGRNIGLIMADIDHFKRINDCYGHAAGDEALKAVTKVLSANLRSGNVIGRWGGEEFLAIVGDTTPAGLRVYAERCRQRISAMEIASDKGTMRVSISLGATMIDPLDTELSAIDRADQMLYRSKEAGRNRVTLG